MAATMAFGVVLSAVTVAEALAVGDETTTGLGATWGDVGIAVFVDVVTAGFAVCVGVGGGTGCTVVGVGAELILGVFVEEEVATLSLTFLGDSVVVAFVIVAVSAFVFSETTVVTLLATVVVEAATLLLLFCCCC